MKCQSEVETAPESSSITDFWDVLNSFRNQSLWKYFRCGGDGSWITRGLTASTLDCISDGSYMQEVSQEVCSAAVLIKCRYTVMEVVGTIVEESDSADNYWGEILRATMTQLVLRAASHEKHTSFIGKMVHIATTRVLYCMEMSGESLCQRNKPRLMFYASLSNISGKTPLLRSTSGSRHIRTNIRVGTNSLSISSNSMFGWTIWLAKPSWKGSNSTISSQVFSYSNRSESSSEQRS